MTLVSASSYNMELTLPSVGKGVYGEVFRIGSKAYKLFRSENHQISHINGVSEELLRKVFWDQVKAYQLIQGNPQLCEHTPEYYGEVTIDRVRDGDGEDVSHEFLLDCCYCMEFHEGESTKIGRVSNDYSHVQDFMKSMRDASIKYLADCDVISAHSETEFVLIDFGTYRPD